MDSSLLLLMHRVRRIGYKLLSVILCHLSLCTVVLIMIAPFWVP